jgi:heme/copper-type cytochrome/quinol oxidase subunit 3
LEPPAPSRLPGVRPGGAYGAILGALVGAVIVGVLVFSYCYLAVNTPTWPPDGVPDPAIVRPVLGAVAIMVAAAAVVGARGGLVDDDERRRLVPALVLASVFGALGTVLLWIETANQPFAADAHSYAAAVFVCYGTVVTLLCTCLYANVFLAACVVRGKVGLEHDTAGAALRTLWAFTAIVTVVLVTVVLVGGRTL